MSSLFFTSGCVLKYSTEWYYCVVTKNEAASLPECEIVKLQHTVDTTVVAADREAAFLKHLRPSGGVLEGPKGPKVDGCLLRPGCVEVQHALVPLSGYRKRNCLPSGGLHLEYSCPRL